MDDMHAHVPAQMDRERADACAFGRGGAESTTFDQLTTDSRPIPNGVITTLSEKYVSASGAISVCIYHWITIVSHDYTRYNINNVQALSEHVNSNS